VIDFRNTNLVWASVLVETLRRLGLAKAVICPGSRSAPLAVAFAQRSPQDLNAIPVLDERSASFFALGLARRSHRPVALVCTSGTAGANFYPAVIEAYESRVPLLILTADRPPELRHCNAGQAIDQQKLYGTFPNAYAELALPEPTPTALAYLRQTLVQAWRQTLFPVSGPVHLNLPFRDPLVPVADQPAIAKQVAALEKEINWKTFFSMVPSETRLTVMPSAAEVISPKLLANWQNCDRGLLVAGPVQPVDPKAYCEAVAHLAQGLGWPVLAEGLSPLRNFAHRVPTLVTTYDSLLHHPDLARELAPTQVIRLGDMPTSKVLRQWLHKSQPQQWIVDPSDRNLDPLHGLSQVLPISVESLRTVFCPGRGTVSEYTNRWLQIEAEVQSAIADELNSLTILFEGKIAWLLSQHLPTDTPIFIASSTPVRDVERFWQAGNQKIQPFFNRGANGIDGTLSTAMGIAYGNQPAVLLTGDLAFLHDSNGLLIKPQFQGHLTIVLINNQGGGIFDNLPIADFDPPFTEFFATPQAVSFSHLCRAHDISHQLIMGWSQFVAALNPLPTEGIRVLEIRCDRRADAQYRRQLLDSLLKQS